MKKKIIIATIKSWNLNNAKQFKKRCSNKYSVLIIDKKEDLNYRKIAKFNPGYIFFPHWSWMIPKSIFENFECVVFHMTDLPFGRGGSPLQNLVSRGIKRTRISAIKVGKELDAGPVYMKIDLNLNGSATDIYKKTAEIVFGKIIPVIISGETVPVPQKGRAVIFKRRSSLESDISGLRSANKVFDWIRMLDAEGYPAAFIESEGLKIEFYNAKLYGKYVTATAKIKVKR